jgi:excisionase family DNA binding protein
MQHATADNSPASNGTGCNNSWMTVAEVANRMRISAPIVYALIRTGQLGHLRWIKRIRITQDHYREFEQRHNRPASACRRDQAGTTNSTDPIHTLDAMAKGEILQAA